MSELSRTERVARLGVVILLTLAGCRSPEAMRTRGGGPGADVRNRDPVVEMHAGSRMYYETPCLLPNDSCTGPRQASGMPGEFPDPPPAQRRQK
jgi:hypothetical protein